MNLSIRSFGLSLSNILFVLFSLFVFLLSYWLSGFSDVLSFSDYPDMALNFSIIENGHLFAPWNLQHIFIYGPLSIIYSITSDTRFAYTIVFDFPFIICAYCLRRYTPLWFFLVLFPATIYGFLNNYTAAISQFLLVAEFSPFLFNSQLLKPGNYIKGICFTVFMNPTIFLQYCIFILPPLVPVVKQLSLTRGFLYLSLFLSTVVFSVWIIFSSKLFAYFDSDLNVNRFPQSILYSIILIICFTFRHLSYHPNVRKFLSYSMFAIPLYGVFNIIPLQRSLFYLFLSSLLLFSLSLYSKHPASFNSAPFLKYNPSPYQSFSFNLISFRFLLFVTIMIYFLFTSMKVLYILFSL